MNVQCPQCGSNNVRFRPNRNNYICDDCDHVFEAPGEKKEPAVRVFVSYGHDKMDLVLTLVGKMKEAGFDVWTDKDIPEGATWRESITSALLGSDKTIAFLSCHSVRRESVCLDELAIAVGCGIPVVSVLLDAEAANSIPATINGIQYVDLSHLKMDDSRSVDKAVAVVARLVREKDSGNEQLEFLRRRLNQGCHATSRLKELRQVYQRREWLDHYIDNWFGNRHKTLLVEGYPGAGKSFYCSHYFHYNPMTAGLVFCDDIYYEKDIFTGIVKRVAFSLAVKYPEYRSNLIWQLNAELQDLSVISGEMLMDYLIVRPLQRNIDGAHPFSLVVIDGVDLLDKSDKNTLVQICLTLSERIPDYIGFLFTARQSPAVNSLFASSEILQIRPNSKEARGDIERFIREELPGRSDKEYSRLSDRCRGSFMFANILIGFIRDGGEDIASIQSGELYRLYLLTMRKLFKDPEDYMIWKDAVSILVRFDNIPVRLFCTALGWVENMFLRFRKKFLSLTEISIDSYKEKVISFVYPSFKAWITEEEHDYQTTPDIGTKRMASLVLRTPVAKLHRYLLLHVIELIPMAGNLPDLPERILQVGSHCLKDSLHFSEAEAYFQVFEALTRETDSLRRSLLPYLRGKKSFLAGDFESCAQILSSLEAPLNSTEDRQDCLYMLATAYDILGKRKESVRLFLQLLETTNNGSFYVKALCGLLWNDHFNDMDSGMTHLERLDSFRGLSSSEVILKELIHARYLLSQGELCDALERFDRIVQGDTSGIWGYDSVSSRNQMLLIESVVACFDNNLFEKGIAIGKAILERLEGHGSIAECYCASWIAMNCLYDGQYDEAATYLHKCQGMNRSDGNERSAWMTMHLTSIEGFQETELGRYALARERHESVLNMAIKCDDAWVAGDALFELFCLSYLYGEKGSLTIPLIAEKLRRIADRSKLSHLDYKARVVETVLTGTGTQELVRFTLDVVSAGKLPSVDEVRAFRLCLTLPSVTKKEVLEKGIQTLLGDIISKNPAGRYTERPSIIETLKLIEHER